MQAYIHSTIAMLAVINPFVCGVLLLQIQADKDKNATIIAALKAMFAVLLILIIAAVGGQYILRIFGISMEAFKIVGGIILAFIGFQMLAGPNQINQAYNYGGGLSKLIMFAASPGTIAMVITLADIHNAEGFPLYAVAGAITAVVVTIIIIVSMILFSSDKKRSEQTIVSRFMGLIIVAMGLQFMLDGIRHFFGV